jgi:anti-sigma regulatory factor (Ser/Thr protein kinase)
LSFKHEAMMYDGREQFVVGTSSFIREGLAAGEPTLVMVKADKIGWLRDELQGDADSVQFADMDKIGRNPARIIPAWRDFAHAHAKPGRGVRGIGEPIWAGRSPTELVECQHHESLLNKAFADTTDFRLICPYDTSSLPPAVVDEARRSHPAVRVGGAVMPSDDYRGDHDAAYAFGDPLPEPKVPRHVLPFGVGTLQAVRKFAGRQAALAGMSEPKKDDVLFVVNEVATNSVRHAGGQGQLRAWRDRNELVFEIRDDGRIREPLVGRTRPALGQIDGMGLWLVNQLCELVQVRSSAAGTVVRMHIALS